MKSSIFFKDDVFTDFRKNSVNNIKPGSLLKNGV